MNELSWFLYLAGVAGNVGAFFAIFGGAASIVATIFGVVGCIASGDGWRPPTGFWRNVFTALTVGGVMILLAALVPSQQTMYAIAASEFGEQLAKTETAGKAFEALNAWLDQQIGSAAGED